jgi:nucleoside-diphosphate-sugar epimerase
VLDGRTVLPTVALIDACYRNRKPLEDPASALPAEPGERSGGVSAGPGRVLVTGATGFLGCRVAEILCMARHSQVRAVVHTPGNASRLARLPVETVVADLRKQKDARRLVEGCDAVVHCAVGTTRGSRADFFDVSVEGTRRLVDSALETGIERFVHMSSIAAFGLVPGMILDESTALRPAPGDDYAEAKAEAERIVLRAAERGLAAVVLRPTRIFGPFARDHVVEPLEKLRAGRLAIDRRAVHSPSQTVFVDDVVAAVERALAAPSETVTGRAFVIGAGDDVSCDAFYRFFADASGLPLPIVDGGNARRVGAPATAVPWKAFGDLLASSEFVSFANRVLDDGSLGAHVRVILDSSPRIRTLVRRVTKLDPAVYERRESEPPPIEVIEPREAAISLQAAERILGYRSSVPRREAMQRTLEWARHAGIIPSPG